jgi:4-amino-4-deoxy-L-arabinose transferase-like glycosyltransferase
VTEPSIPIAENPPASRAARIGWAILILATLYVCYFSHLGAIGFVGPDEPRYAWIARDMAETGDWVTPRLYGKPWFEKPPLFYWGAAASFKLFGVSEAAARLPSAISALLATLALAWLALRIYGAETARWLLLLLPTTVGMIGFSHAAATDMPFSAMLTIAMVCAAVVLGLTRNENTPILPYTPWLALILFGFFLGAAVLAKGPAAIILSGGAVFFWALFTKRWRDAFRLLHPVAIASFCLTALPWYILCARRNPDFFRIFIIEHNLKRFLTPEFQHIQPFWYYIPVLLVSFIPWTAILLWSVSAGAKRLWQTRRPAQSTWLFFCWAGFCIAFFSISRSKLPGYVLPTLPPISLIFTADLVKRFRSADSKIRWIGALTGTTILLLAVIGFRFGESTSISDIRPAQWINPDIFLAFPVGILVVFLAILGKSRATFIVSAGFLLFALYEATWNPWDFDAVISTRWVADLMPKDHPGFNPLEVATYKVRRPFHYQLNFYLHRELPEWDGTETKTKWLLVSPQSVSELQLRGFQCESNASLPVLVCERPKDMILSGQPPP